MNKTVTVCRARNSSTPIEIELVCFKMNALIRQKVSGAQYSRDIRPYLVVIMRRQPSTIFRCSITVGFPSPLQPVKEPVFLEHTPSARQGANLKIRAESSLFGFNRHFSTASFAQQRQSFQAKTVPERTLSKLIRAASGQRRYDDSAMNNFNNAERLTTTTLSKLMLLTLHINHSLHSTNY